MHIRSRLFAATAVAAATLAVPATMALSSGSAHASNNLCVHLYIAEKGKPPILNIGIVVIPPISIVQGACPA
jgi:hypothetical protein